MDKSINFRNFFFVLWPMFQLAWPSDIILKKKTLDFDRQLYGLFLHPWKLNIHIETTRYQFDNN